MADEDLQSLLPMYYWQEGCRGCGWGVGRKGYNLNLGLNPKSINPELCLHHRTIPPPQRIKTVFQQINISNKWRWLLALTKTCWFTCPDFRVFQMKSRSWSSDTSPPRASISLVVHISTSWVTQRTTGQNIAPTWTLHSTAYWLTEPPARTHHTA